MARDARRTDPQAHARASSKGGGGRNGRGGGQPVGRHGRGGELVHARNYTVVYTTVGQRGEGSNTPGPGSPAPPYPRVRPFQRRLVLRMDRNVADTIAQHFTRHGSRPPLA